MIKKGLQTPKGFRDFLPNQAKARTFLLGKLKTTLERFGFEPLETPGVEFAETLKGKYGEEEKLIFEFTDRGGRSVGLRYDQTVPLARVIASNPSLPKPFKRYQIQPVWRAENPQKGRFREFVQVDFDIVGTDSPLADAEVVAAAISATKEAGFDDFVLKVNDRDNFKSMQPEVIGIIDKLQKIGELSVVEQLKKFGYDRTQAKALIKTLKESAVTKKLKKFFDLLESYKISKDNYAYDPTLARGLDYYTGIIYELEIEGYGGGSTGSGGRYDDLIGKFSGSRTPSVGFSFGLDRMTEAGQELKKLPQFASISKVLVTIFNEKLVGESLQLVGKLRDQGIAAEISLNPEEKLEKQLRYADSKSIPFVAILGPEEIKDDKIALKDLSSRQQTKITFSELKRKLA